VTIGSRYLVVNADDFGRSPAINEGVIQAHERGIVTSASLMVRWRDADTAALYARSSALAVGLHVDLGEWTVRDGEWSGVYTVVELTDERAVRNEIEHQLEKFRSLCGRNPTHLDSHQHLHLTERITGDILDALAAELGIPLRSRSSVEYCGAFYGQERDGAPARREIGKKRLIELVRSVPPGVTELGCHPATRHDTDSMYGVERAFELRALCDPDVKRAVDEAAVRLVSFANVPR
jgi:predicted glycoside hydrolase/deacetylase ChbG (UPF0249 family)